MNITNIIRALCIIYIILTSIYVGALMKKNSVLTAQLDIARANEKAYIISNSQLKERERVFKMSIEQLEYMSDSLTKKIDAVRKELKIKDKNLKQMQYLLSEAQRRDTIVFRDTLFRDPVIKIDTLVGDEWYQMKLGLRYPSTIITSPKFISEKFVMINYKKETVNPPKKFFLARWFQKRHKVVEVEVVEKNPYIENKQQRFIEIIK